MSDKLVEALSTMQEQEALSIVEEMLSGGTEPLDILQQCKKAMAIVGDNFASGKYFLPELVMAGEMLLQISKLIKPKLQAAATGGESGRVRDPGHRSPASNRARASAAPRCGSEAGGPRRRSNRALRTTGRLIGVSGALPP